MLESASPGLSTEEEREIRRGNDRKLAKRILENGMEAFVDQWENIPLFESQKRLSANIPGQPFGSNGLANNPPAFPIAFLAWGPAVKLLTGNNCKPLISRCSL